MAYSRTPSTRMTLSSLASSFVVKKQPRQVLTPEQQQARLEAAGIKVVLNANKA